jgi:hypothetical protein
MGRLQEGTAADLIPPRATIKSLREIACAGARDGPSVVDPAAPDDESRRRERASFVRDLRVIARAM